MGLLKGRRIMGYGQRQKWLAKAARTHKQLKYYDRIAEETQKNFEPKTILRKAPGNR